jgi:hypothetical protein
MCAWVAVGERPAWTPNVLSSSRVSSSWSIAAKTRAHLAQPWSGKRADDGDLGPGTARWQNPHHSATLRVRRTLRRTRNVHEHLHRLGDELRASRGNPGGRARAECLICRALAFLSRACCLASPLGQAGCFSFAAKKPPQCSVSDSPSIAPLFSRNVFPS